MSSFVSTPADPGAVAEAAGRGVSPQPAANSGTTRVPSPVNEPNRAYLPGSAEREQLKARLRSMSAERIAIPLARGGREIRTGAVHQAVMPHDHRHVLADWHAANADDVVRAIAAAKDAAADWARWRWEDRAAVFLRGAALYPFHRQHGCVQQPVARRGRENRPLPHLSAPGRRNGRQGFHRRPPVG